MLILDNHAMPIYYRYLPSRPMDFKKLADGRLVYFDTAPKVYYAMNTMYAVVDSFKMGNGYTTDFHDLQVLPGNHALLLAYDPQPVDMSVIVPGGDPDAVVTGLIIQEIDAAKNVIFQWRSWDHYQITDVTDCHSLTTPTVDAVHGNSLESDYDGNILVSSRYLDEITKINRQTGDIIWRFGKNSRNNQFTILDDSLGFSDQHDARRLPNGNLTLYDNHSCLDPKNSRALEYEIDEQTLTARLVWEYRHTPDQHSTATGNVQRRASGGTMVGWGTVPGPPNLTDLHADGSTALEITFWPSPTLTGGYRCFRFPWRATVFTPNFDVLDFGALAQGDSASRPLTITNNSASGVTLTSFVTLDGAFAVEEAVPLAIPAGDSVTVHVKFLPGSLGSYSSTLYLRSSTSTQVIAYPVLVQGSSYDPASAPLDPAPGVELSVSPIPSRGTTEFAYSLPHAARIRLAVLDAQGRVVAVLANGLTPAGRYRTTWNAQRTGGRIPAGLYFARLEGLGDPVVRRLIIAR
jgi:arylsulfotransferase ASST/ASPM-SPD-2-Hydin domain-containing protein